MVFILKLKELSKAAYNFLKRDSSYKLYKAASYSVIKMTFDYPVARRDETVKEVHFGTEVSDPYRWLEDPDSEETRAFVDAQNKVTLPYLTDCPDRDKLQKKLTQIWDYPKFSCPYRHGNRYFYYMNTGLQNQSVLYMQEGLDGEPRVFLDPNTLSDDGTVAVSGTCFSEDDKIMAYTLSKSGSDWVTIHFRDVETGIDLPDVLERVKFTSLDWTHDNEGVFYSCFPVMEGKKDGSETTSYKNNKLYYHRLGTSQADDVLVVEFLDEPDFLIDAEVSNCGQWVLIMARKLCKDNLLYFCDLKSLSSGISGKLPLTQVVHRLEADYIYVTNKGSEFIFQTNKDAPNYRLIKIDFRNPDPSNWTTLVPQHETDVLDWASICDFDKLVLCYLHDVKDVLSVHSLESGKLIRKLPIPLGTITGYSGRWNYPEIFYQFTSFLSPGIIYRCDLSKTDPMQDPTVFREIVLPGFNRNEFEQNQIFYPSKDGTNISMFIIHKKGIKRDGSNPCLLYGYGGFNKSIQPVFSTSRLVWMKFLSGIVAIANIRGGGEFGEKWHDAGRLLNKQNGFDDFQSAAEYLIAEKYTRSGKLVIQGSSNGGLLVAACLNQRPDLFKAGIIQVGVLDLLRYHKFTVGALWISDYGNPDEEKHFKNLVKLSPLHNIPQIDSQYPATLMLTADHDDRVVPLHSLKFIATLQHTLRNNNNQENPVLLKVDTKAGHGDGKPTTKIIEENTDIFCFLIKNLGLTFLE